MPNWVSKGGTWHPAKEKVALTDHEGKDGRKPGDPYIYDGADRGALFELFREKVEALGQDFKTDPAFIQSVRNQGFNTVDEYLKFIGYDEEKDEKEFKKKAKKVTKHEIEKTVKAIETVGGGQNYYGPGRHRLGGFGEPKE